MFTARRIYISASTSEPASLASRLSLPSSLVPRTSTRIFKMNKSSGREILQGMIQRESKGDCCSRAVCWHIAILLKTAAAAAAKLAGSNSQSDAQVCTCVDQVHFFTSEDSSASKELGYVLQIKNCHYLDPELPIKSIVAVWRFALIRASDTAE